MFPGTRRALAHKDVGERWASMLRSVRSNTSMFESLEPRTLLAFTNWSAADQLIQLPDALQAFQNKGITLNGAGQTIAVLDSGVDYNLPQLGGGFGPGFKVEAGYDFVDHDNDPMDPGTGTVDPGHGTETAGLLAANQFTSGGLTYQGIAPGAKLVALRIYDGTNPVPDSTIADALQWVIDHRTQYNITVVSISFGQGSYDSPTVSSVYGDQIQELHDEGVAIVASSGDFNGDVQPTDGITSPAADPNVISVGSVNASDVISSFGQRGPDLSLLAPGEDVTTTLLGGGFGAVAGTSYSAPIVAGTIALMRQIDPTLTPDDELSILRASGVRNFDGDAEIGSVTRLIYPRLDILNAVNMTEARIPAPAAEQALLGQYGNGNGIAVDAEGVTHLVYYDAGTKTMEYATRSTAGNWSALQTIDDSMPYQGYYLSLALSPQGQPTVAYFDGVNGDLKFAAYNGTSWNIQSIDIKNSTGLYPSLLYDRNGLPLIAYYKKTTGDLRVARQSFQGAWTITTIDSEDDTGRSVAAAIDPNGRVGLAYEDSDSGWLKYAIMDPRTGIFSKTTIDRTTHGIAFISTAFSTDDNSPWVSYYDARPANLKVAYFKNRTWTPETLASRGATGLFTNLFFDDDDQANILYYDKHHDALYLATMEQGTWDYTLLQSNGGREASIALDPDNGVFQYTYYDSATAYIKLADQNI